jgi:hypothetical protein
MVWRVTGLEELTEWLAAAAGQGADRFELWIKQRGCDSVLVKAAAQKDPFDIADELLATVERDRRADLGQVAYAVYAYRGKEPSPFERAFLQPGSRAIAVPFGANAIGAGDGSGPALAVTSLLAQMQHMNQEVFGTLQRENESQRRTNETMVRSSTSHFETLTKSYERTFGDLQQRYDAVLRENAELRSQNDALTRVNKESRALYEDLHKVKMDEAGKEQRKTMREAALMDNLKLLAPVLVSKFTHRPIDPSTLGVPALEQFIASLAPAQIEGILALLRPEQALFLIELIQSHQAKAGGPPDTAPGQAPPPPPGGPVEAAAEAPPSHGAEADVAHHPETSPANDVAHKEDEPPRGD